MRSKAKRLAYGLLYGMGVDRLAQQLECGSEAARGQAEGFKRCLAGVEDWKKWVAASAERQGFVQTIGGRKRFFGELRGRRGRLTDDQRAACARQSSCQRSASAGGPPAAPCKLRNAASPARACSSTWCHPPAAAAASTQ